MNWEKVSLREVIIDLASGGRPKGGAVESGIFSIGAEHLDGKGGFNISNPKFIPIEYFNTIGKAKIKNEDILVVKDGATTGKVSYVGKNFPLNEAAINEHVFRIELNLKLIFPKYCFYYLISDEGQRNILSDFRGATVGGISKAILDKIKIPLPPLPVQKRIAEILDAADDLKRKDKALLKKYDELAQSIFIDMFGDPVKNEKGWEVKKFGVEFNSIRYGTGSPPKYSESGIPFLRATNIKNGGIVEKGMVYLTHEEACKIEKCYVNEGDLLLVRSGANTGDCAFVPQKYSRSLAGYDLIIELDINKSRFYNYLINSKWGKAMVDKLSRRAGQPHLNAEQVRNMEFISPTYNKLKEFKESLDCIDKLKEKTEKVMLKNIDLFQTLTQKAFKGELVW